MNRKDTHMKFRQLTVIGLASLIAHSAMAAETSELSLEDILNLKVTTASKQAEKLSEAPATMMVLTRSDLQHRG